MTGSRHRLNLISVVSSEGAMRYQTFTGTMDQHVFVKYLKLLVRSITKPMIIITDGHPAHRLKLVRVCGIGAKIAWFSSSPQLFIRAKP
ncbi:MAG: transposase [Endozoicomonadaceae bacterium]|nr:transposase [Endozoicomonadaceae bacterium]